MTKTKTEKTVCVDCDGTRVKNQDFINLAACSMCAARVAAEFSRVLRRWLTPAELAMAIRLNKLEPSNSIICHSHDFCDANMAMYEAFTTLGFTATCDVEAVESSEYAASQALWNAAWLIAFKADFSPIMCSANLAEVK